MSVLTRRDCATSPRPRGFNVGMTPEEFRAAGHQLIDWVADHRARIPDLPVAARTRPGEISGALPVHAPQEPESLEAVLADLDAIVVRGVTQTQHPGFYGWFPSNASLSSVLGDIASGGLAALGITWQSAPALTEVEQVGQVAHARLLALGCGDERDETQSRGVGDRLERAGEIFGLLSAERLARQRRAAGGRVFHGQRQQGRSGHTSIVVDIDSHRYSGAYSQYRRSSIFATAEGRNHGNRRRLRARTRHDRQLHSDRVLLSRA